VTEALQRLLCTIPMQPLTDRDTQPCVVLSVFPDAFAQAFVASCHDITRALSAASAVVISVGNAAPTDVQFAVPTSDDPSVALRVVLFAIARSFGVVASPEAAVVFLRLSLQITKVSGQ
jgi:hypothetical protein